MNDSLLSVTWMFNSYEMFVSIFSLNVRNTIFKCQIKSKCTLAYLFSLIQLLRFFGFCQFVGVSVLWWERLCYTYISICIFLILTSNLFQYSYSHESVKSKICMHDGVIKWNHFPRYWPFVREIHRSPVNSPHKGQWRGALMFSFIFAWTNRWAMETPVIWNAMALIMTLL